MIRILISTLAVAIAGSALASDPGSCGPRQVAFTFDDPPLGDSVVMSGDERTRRIIDALRDGGVEEAMFFAVGSRINEGTVARIHAYAAAGHTIANHSHTHPNLHEIGSDRFLMDVAEADRILSDLPGFSKFFRFPYLNEGSTVEERDATRAGLDRLGYRAGYVTIDNWDFFINRLLHEAHEAHGPVRLDAIERVYVDMIMDAAAHYDAVACHWLGRSPTHVLLLHENDAAALFLPELITAMRADGWVIVPATSAFEDPIAEVVPDTLFLGQGRVAALAHLTGAEPAQLRHKGEDGDALREAFAMAAAEDPEVLAIRKAGTRFSAAYVDGDIEGLMGLYANDAVIAPPGRAFLSNDELRAYWTPRTGIVVTRHRLYPVSIEVHGDIAYDWGRYEGAMGPVGAQRDFSGKYLVVWRRDPDRMWRMVQDMWNQDHSPDR